MKKSLTRSHLYAKFVPVRCYRLVNSTRLYISAQPVLKNANNPAGTLAHTHHRHAHICHLAINTRARARERRTCHQLRKCASSRGKTFARSGPFLSLSLSFLFLSPRGWIPKADAAAATAASLGFPPSGIFPRARRSLIFLRPSRPCSRARSLLFPSFPPRARSRRNFRLDYFFPGRTREPAARVTKERAEGKTRAVAFYTWVCVSIYVTLGRREKIPIVWDFSRFFHCTFLCERAEVRRLDDLLCRFIARFGMDERGVRTRTQLR